MCGNKNSVSGRLFTKGLHSFSDFLGCQSLVEVVLIDENARKESHPIYVARWVLKRDKNSTDNREN